MATNTGELDELLDSALDDFQNMNLKPSSSKSVEREERAPLPANIQGLGLGLPDLKGKKRGKQKLAASAKNEHVSETLNKLRQQTREAVKGLEESVAMSGEGGDLNTDNLEDLVKQFEELAGSHDLESMVATMMQQLLSKEILYEPMKELGERYPNWLKDHKSALSEEDYMRYSYQYELINELNGVYDTDPNNFTKIFELMQKMQECGHPPNDIVQDLAPDFNLSQFGQLSLEMLESQQNCSIM